jgi:excisionase family DNA binding protein
MKKDKIGKDQNPQIQQFYSRVEAAEKLRYCVITIGRWTADGTLPSVKIGRRVLIPVEGIERLIDKAMNGGNSK